MTPDIPPGDKVTISLAGTPAGDTTVQDAYVTDKSVLAGSTLTVTGHIGAGVNPAQTEQRIVEAGLTATAVGKRDIRAVPGPLTPATSGAYSSSLEFAGTTFTATYACNDPAVAQVAADASLGGRLLSWQFVDPAANRQGVTIAERGEPGSPGVGGCPNGPRLSGPPGPTGVTAVNVTGGVKLPWTPAVALSAGCQPGRRAGRDRPTDLQRPPPAPRSPACRPPSSTTSRSVAVSSVGQTFPPVTAVPQTDVTPPTAKLYAGAIPITADTTRRQRRRPPERCSPCGCRTARPQAANPGTVWIESTLGGISGPFTVG